MNSAVIFLAGVVSGVFVCFLFSKEIADMMIRKSCEPIEDAADYWKTGRKLYEEDEE